MYQKTALHVHTDVCYFSGTSSVSSEFAGEQTEVSSFQNEMCSERSQNALKAALSMNEYLSMIAVIYKEKVGVKSCCCNSIPQTAP